MQVLASITSKRQLTIPISIFEKLGFRENSKVVVTETKEGMLVKTVSSLIDELAGSVDIPKSLKGVSAEQAIQEAIKMRFGKNI